MRKVYVSWVIFLTAILVFIPIVSEAAPCRKPIKLYCNLIKKSKFLFWSYESTRSVQIDIYDSNKNGEYDTYKWWEDGAVRHTGKFSHGNEDSVCEKRLGQLAKSNVVSYYSNKEDEYFIKIKSKKDNSNLGFLIVDSEFKKDLKYERYYESEFGGKLVVPYGPSKATLRNHMFLYFKIDRKKNKLKNSRLYLWFDSTTAYIEDTRYEIHKVTFSDFNNDGIYEDYAYFADDCVLFVSQFVQRMPSEELWKKFRYEILNKGISNLELFDGKFRMSLYSKRDKKNIGYLEIESTGDNLMTYSDVTSFSDPKISTAAKFGICHPSAAYVDYVNFVCQEPGFLDPKLKPYQGNVFINEYLEELERSSRAPQIETVFSLDC